MYNVSLWCACKIVVAMDMQQCVVCTVELHVTVNNIKIFNGAQKMRLWRVYVAGNYKTHISYHIKCPTFLSDFLDRYS